MAEERGRVCSLERSLEQTKVSLASLQTTCSQQEKELLQSTDATQATILKLEELSATNKDKDQRVGALEEQLRSLQETSSASIEQLSQQLQMTRDDVVSSKDVVDTAKTEAEMAKKIEYEAKKNIEEARREVLAVQQKYEREVMLHGNDLQALAKLKEDTATHTSAMEKLTSDKVVAEETLIEVRRAGTDLEQSLRRENSSLKERISEIEEQNKVLLEQFTQLSNKMAVVHTKLSQDGNESLGNVSLSEDETRSSDQLREVVKYLRRERELATGRCDVAQAETARLKAQLESSSKLSHQLTQELAQERENKQVSTNTASRYGELLRKVHTVDALADSNRLLRQEKDVLQTRADDAKARAQTLEAQVEPLNIRLAEAVAEAETTLVEKTALEKEAEMYKKRTSELVEKLNRAKPEEFMRMQVELGTSRNTLQNKELDCTRLRMQVSQLQKNIQTMVTSRQNINQQLTAAKEEKSRITEDAKKLSNERSRMVEKVGQQQERIAAMQAAQQQEQLKQLEQRNTLLAQIGDLKQREESARRDLDQVKKEMETTTRAAAESKQHVVEGEVQKADLQKQMSQLRKIATKYKKAAETAAEEEGSSAAAKVKELETTICGLKQQLEGASASDNRDQEDMSRTKLMEAELTRVRQELDARSKETLALRGAVNKKIEEVTAKKTVFESRITQLEKDKEQLSGQLETLSLKLTVQQRQIMMDSATWQKQSSPGTSKPSTSGGSSADKSPSEPPPTANIKPLAAATPSVTMSSPRGTPIPTPPSRTIPTASIRPLAPPPNPGVGIVPPRDIHSEGLVSSSTVTLPQATVTPTPATPSATLPTTATTAATQPVNATHTTAAMSACVATLTATVSPTPVSASLPLIQGGSTSVVSRSVAATATASQQCQQASTQQVSMSGASAGASTSGSVASAAPAVPQEQQQAEAMDQGTSSQGSDQLVSQAIAMIVVPGQDQQQPPAGPSTHKRKRDGEEERDEDEESKRSRVEQEASSDSVSQGSSGEQQSVQPEAGDATSSQQGEAHMVMMDQSAQSHDDVILVDSDEDGDEHESSEVVQQQQRRIEVEESEAEERQQPGLADDDQQQQQQQQQQQKQDVQHEVDEAPSESHQPMHPQMGSSSSSMQQLPSSSSTSDRQAALVLPRPSALNDRVGSSGQHL